MKFKEYCMDKIILILLNVVGMLLLSEYLSMVGNTASTIILIDIFWGCVLFGCLMNGWYNRNKYFTKLEKRVETLTKPWLISEVLPVSFRLEDQKFQKVIRNIGAAAIEEIHKMEDEQKEYEEYIENWIHEVKTPITLLYLLVNNNVSDETVKKEIVMELKRIENDVESALYYARLGTAYQDFIIQKISLGKMLKEVIMNNRVLLMSNGFAIELCCDEDVIIYSDCKWVMFMLNQVMINAVKYANKRDPEISLTAIQEDTTVVLQVKDNGIGILEEDLPRIFEKGYTGKNGHNNTKSTGFGLYLVKKMCEKLDIGVKAASEKSKFTVITFCFKKKLYFDENLSKL